MSSNQKQWWYLHLIIRGNIVILNFSVSLLDVLYFLFQFCANDLALVLYDLFSLYHYSVICSLCFSSVPMIQPCSHRQLSWSRTAAMGSISTWDVHKPLLKEVRQLQRSKTVYCPKINWDLCLIVPGYLPLCGVTHFTNNFLIVIWMKQEIGFIVIPFIVISLLHIFAQNFMVN